MGAMELTIAKYVHSMISRLTHTVFSKLIFG